MGPELEKAIMELSLRMRLLRAQQEEADGIELTERDVLLLQVLHEKDQMRVSQIAETYPSVSESTISTNLTKLWRKGFISKHVSPDNQRVTIVRLKDKGREMLAVIRKQRAERFNALFHAIQVSPDEKQTLITICDRAVKFMDEHLAIGGNKKSI